MLSGTENIVASQLKCHCPSCDSANTARGGNSSCSTQGLQPVSRCRVMGGSPAEMWVQGIPPPPAPSIPLPRQHSSARSRALNQPEELLSLQNNPTKTSQFMSNFHEVCLLTPDPFPGCGHNATHSRGMEAAAWEQEQTERGGEAISMTS